MHDKTLWINEDIQYMFNENIVEYDMKAASVSVCERFNLLEESLIQQLKLMPKEQRTRKMGMLQRDNYEFSEKLLTGIKNIRRKFLETNGITENDIIAIHSDAVIFSSRKSIITDIEGVEFRMKGTWSSYMRYDNIEMLYDNDYITYKNASKDNLFQHTLGMTKHLKQIFMYMENCDEDVFKYLSKFQSMYLSDRLPIQYYVPFGKVGEIKVTNLTLLAHIANIVLSASKGW